MQAGTECISYIYTSWTRVAVLMPPYFLHAKLLPDFLLVCTQAAKERAQKPHDTFKILIPLIIEAKHP